MQSSGYHIAALCTLALLCALGIHAQCDVQIGTYDAATTIAVNISVESDTGLLGLFVLSASTHPAGGGGTDVYYNLSVATPTSPSLKLAWITRYLTRQTAQR